MNFINKLSHSSQEDSTTQNPDADAVPVGQKLTSKDTQATGTSSKCHSSSVPEDKTPCKKNETFASKLNTAAGGGSQGENDEDGLDKGELFLRFHA